VLLAKATIIALLAVTIFLRGFTNCLLMKSAWLSAKFSILQLLEVSSVYAVSISKAGVAIELFELSL